LDDATSGGEQGHNGEQDTTKTEGSFHEQNGMGGFEARKTRADSRVGPPDLMPDEGLAEREKEV
jgi:hypothetical protein